MLLLCIDNAIKRAWRNVLKKHKKQLHNYSEEEITEKLEDEIQKIMDAEDESGFNRSVFQTISRGAKFCSYNNAHLEKQPDLTLRKVDLTPGIFDSRQDALFIECKLIDGRNKSPLNYIKHGIRRFVDGEYAWAMPHSMMIAYVRDGKKIPSAIKDTFKRNSQNALVVHCSPTLNQYNLWVDSMMPQTYKTDHTRLWNHKLYGPPCDISISHVWLNCS